VSLTINNSQFRKITPGIETLPYAFRLPRHRHLRAYATVVLAGTFQESGYNGRIQATAGDSSFTVLWIVTEITWCLQGSS
jgi:hypothetical protein